MAVLTESGISRPIRRMARPLNYPEKILLRLTAGTTARIRAMIGDGDVASFIRESIEREIKRRSRTSSAAARNVELAPSDRMNRTGVGDDDPATIDPVNGDLF